MLVDDIRAAAVQLDGWDGCGPLLRRIRGARFVLISGAEHGTRELHRLRAELTARLVDEAGFHAVAVAGDWPAAYRVNRYLRGAGDDRCARDALQGFEQFPTWMWRNPDVVDLVAALREHNQRAPAAAQVGFYGLDFFGMHAALDALLAYLEWVDRAAADEIRQRSGGLEHPRASVGGLAFVSAADLGLSRRCEQDAVAALRALRRQAAEFAASAPLPEDEAFYGRQSVQAERSAEACYRSMLHGRLAAWNLRVRHMAETLAALAEHLDRRLGRPGRARVVIWEHDGFVGDAAATEMGEAGELSLGQLLREREGSAARLIGVTSFGGTVTAASIWGGPAERKALRPALPRSFEALFHEVGMPRFLLDLRDAGRVPAELREPRLQRAVGAVYLPQAERAIHYFTGRLAAELDLLVHVDDAHAVQPPELTPHWRHGELPAAPLGDR